MTQKSLLPLIAVLWTTNLAAKANQATININTQHQEPANLQQLIEHHSSDQDISSRPFNHQLPSEEQANANEGSLEPKTQDTMTTRNTPSTIKEQWEFSDDQKRQALGISGGTFNRGYYSIYNSTTNSLQLCSAWTLCGEGLFGGIGSIDFTQRLFKAGSISLDVDTSAGIGHQDLANSWYKPIPLTDQSKTFGLLSIVPTVRLRLGGFLRPLRFGLGAGLSYAIGSIPYEYPYDIPLMTAINSEIAFQPNPKSKQEIFFSLRHRCAFFGMLNKVDGSQVGSQWYVIGIRSWF